MEYFKNLNIRTGIIVAFIIFFILGVFVQGNPHNDNFLVLISGSSFLFGIFIAFSIANSHTKLRQVNEILKDDEANLLSIYQLSYVFGKQNQLEVKKLIDNYLIDQVDYYLEDFKYSNASFLVIYEYIVDFNPKNSQQTVAYTSLLNILVKSSSNRKMVETFVLDKMLVYEWLSIFSLLGLILFFIFYFNSGGILSGTLSAILSTTAVTLVLVLKDLNYLSWKENKWVWEPLHNLFKSLDLLPYYPKKVIDNKIAILNQDEKIRIAQYPDKYPDMTNKVIKEINYTSKK